MQSVLGGAASAGSQVSSDVVSAIQTVLRAALPSGITQIADQGGLPLQEQIQNAADTLTQDDNQLPQPPKPTSDDITNAVKVCSFLSSCKNTKRHEQQTLSPQISCAASNLLREASISMG